MEDFDARRASLDLVTAFVSNNTLSAGELPALLRDVFTAVSDFKTKTSAATEPVGKATVARVTKPAPTRAEKPVAVLAPGEEPVTPTAEPKAAEARKPAVSVRQSLADPNVIVSLITGESFKTLKRHLTKHGLTEAEYKARFNLPDDYPTVAPAYAEVRRTIASARHAKGQQAQPAAAVASAPAAATEPQATKPAKVAKVTKATSSVRPAKSAVQKAAAEKPAGDAKAEKAKAKAVAQPRTAPAEQSAAKAAPAKPTKQRRMARPPAAELKTEAPVSAAPPAPAPVAPAASSPSPAAIPPRASAPAGGAPAAGAESTPAKPARKERKKLSAKFG